jgi:hypothetical protein
MKSHFQNLTRNVIDCNNEKGVVYFVARRVSAIENEWSRNEQKISIK